MHKYIHSLMHCEDLYSTSSRDYSEVLPTPVQPNKTILIFNELGTY